MPFTKPTKNYTESYACSYARSYARSYFWNFARPLLFIGISLFLALAPLRAARAWYIGVDGFYGAVGIDTLLDELVIIADAGDNLQHGGGGRINFGLGKKWVTEFSVGVYQGRRFSILDRTSSQDFLQAALSDFINTRPIALSISDLSGGVRYQTSQTYATFGLEGRYYVLGDFAYDPDVPNDIFFGLGGDWAIPSFWEGSDYLSALPSMKLVGGYTRRLTRSLFMEIGAEIYVVPTPPANIFNMRLGLKYAF